VERRTRGRQTCHICDRRVSTRYRLNFMEGDEVMRTSSTHGHSAAITAWPILTEGTRNRPTIVPLVQRRTSWRHFRPSWKTVANNGRVILEYDWLLLLVPHWIQIYEPIIFKNHRVAFSTKRDHYHRGFHLQRLANI